MWLCLNCARSFKSDSETPSCPDCRCIGLIPVIDCWDHNELESAWDEISQQIADCQLILNELEDQLVFISDSLDNLGQAERYEKPEHPNCNCSDEDFSDVCSFSKFASESLDTCYGRPANEYHGEVFTPIVFSPLSFHDLNINELLLISETTSIEACNNPTIITEMQDRFLHTFLEDCVVY